MAPLDSPQLADFVGLARPGERGRGRRARVRLAAADGENGDATALRAFEDDAEGADGGILINMYHVGSVDALAAFVYGDAHREVLRRRREWFERLTDVYAVAWWIPRGHIPTIVEAEDRLRHLRRHGPTPHAFTLKVHFPPPDSAVAGPLLSPDDWACTVFRTGCGCGWCTRPF